MSLLRRFFCVVAACSLGLTLGAAPIAATAPQPAAVLQPIDWLEPHGVAVFDLIGEVPEDLLHDAILVYSNNGMLQYQSGSRQGGAVTITVKVTPRYEQAGNNLNTLINCLGQPALTDTWPTVAPAMTMRVFAGSDEITDQAWLWRFAPAGRIHPLNKPTAGFRYPEGDTTAVQFTADGAIDLPAARGCAVVFQGQHSNLTATFTVTTPRVVAVELLGDESFTFHSYIGPGGAGELTALANQMADRYEGRHDKFDLNPPEGAEFVLVTYPPTPVHAYVNPPIELNMQQAASGSYRLARSGGAELSVDHVASYALPLHFQTRDADLSGEADYLPIFTDAVVLASPEYFVPAGVAFDPCMRNGGCPDSLLEQIHNAEMTMTIHYLRIQRTATGLDRIPIQQAGPDWSPGLRATQLWAANRAGVQGPVRRQENDLFMPLITAVAPPPDLPPDDSAGCPCGWFDADGRMVDYVAGP